MADCGGLRRHPHLAAGLEGEHAQLACCLPAHACTSLWSARTCSLHAVSSQSSRMHCCMLHGKGSRSCSQVRNFKSGLELFERIGAIAEEEGHHPDLHLESWNKVRVVLSTHSIGALCKLCCLPRRSIVLLLMGMRGARLDKRLQSNTDMDMQGGSQRTTSSWQPRST